ncbi:DUF1801 domain-containing protein [Chitinophaga sp. Mgbs1]|uniref:DUF1801 domain-containing protein n=1 Tax=Chitinophaga solisilvae TaxID=1233460 RepID=A0A3S1CXJ8_9BACT|nr:DUF1801 domain-containing protein [Chitinophaga solisilvae]
MYIASQPEPKRSDMQVLNRIILEIMPACKLWFLDGKDSENKTVSNPNMGYGLPTIKYADGKTREFYQIGMSANTTGYCIKFKTLKDINREVLEAVIRDGFEGRLDKD